jgi:Cu/Ag efflux protein CusF
MNLSKRAFILALATGLVAQDAVAAKPTIFDFYEYVQRRKAASDAPHEEPWISAMVRAVDRARRRIRITHVPAPSAGMPAMTMTLDVAEDLDVSVRRAGEAVDIRVDMRDGRLVVADIRTRR